MLLATSDLLFKPLKKLRGRGLQSFSEDCNHSQGRISATTFNSRNIGSVETGLKSEALLRQADFRAASAYEETKCIPKSLFFVHE